MTRQLHLLKQGLSAQVSLCYIQEQVHKVAYIQCTVQLNRNDNNISMLSKSISGTEMNQLHSEKLYKSTDLASLTFNKATGYYNVSKLNMCRHELKKPYKHRLLKQGATHN